MANEGLNQQQVLELIVRTLDTKKADDIKVIRIGDLSILADYFVIADGLSSTQTRALADEVEFQLKQNGITPDQVQGANGSDWIIIDCRDIVIHVFSKTQRDFYNLERLWKDGEMIDISSWLV